MPTGCVGILLSICESLALGQLFRNPWNLPGVAGHGKRNDLVLRKRPKVANINVKVARSVTAVWAVMSLTVRQAILSHQLREGFLSDFGYLFLLFTSNADKLFEM
jgi:hypothetical protein